MHSPIKEFIMSFEKQDSNCSIVPLCECEPTPKTGYHAISTISLRAVEEMWFFRVALSCGHRRFGLHGLIKAPSSLPFSPFLQHANEPMTSDNLRSLWQSARASLPPPSSAFAPSLAWGHAHVTSATFSHKSALSAFHAT